MLSRQGATDLSLRCRISFLMYSIFFHFTKPCQSFLFDALPQHTVAHTVIATTQGHEKLNIRIMCAYL